MPRRLKLGTRKSLLALTQSTLILNQLEKAHPGLAIDLVGIETKGDRVTDIPLSKIEGKEFFVKEIDDALLAGDVDFTVHSYKDLSIERPVGIMRAAIPTRFNPRDLVVFNSAVTERIEKGIPLRIGTSSPRRLENAPPFLAKALPRLNSHEPIIEFVEIRGNVNTRLSRLHELEGSERYLDGVVLAFAGLARLARLDDSAVQLRNLLKSTRIMVLPLDLCPAAPAQGALAIECRANDEFAKRVLHSIHDAKTEKMVEAERRLMGAWGGGCHQRFGITAMELEEVGLVLHHRGIRSDGSFIDGIQWNAKPAKPEGVIKPWDGFRFRSKCVPLASPTPPLSDAVFVASYKAVCSDHIKQALKDKRVWVSGVSSWFRLAEDGIWVEGCGEGYGFKIAQSLLTDPLLALPEQSKWSVLTHKGGVKTWQHAKAYATYQVEYQLDQKSIDALRNATHCFWTSFSQYEAYKAHVPENAHHAVGLGKTKEMLRAAGVSVSVFPTYASWVNWIQN